MKQLRRARAMLFVAVAVAVGILVTQLPVSELNRQHNELASVNSELSTVSSHNRQLTQEVAALHRLSVIATIAREDYGLVRRGQQAYVVLPASAAGGAGSASAPSLSKLDISPADLAAGDTSALAGSGIAGTPAPGARHPAPSVWSSALAHLEFWRWAF